MEKVHLVYFSGSGTTRTAARLVAEGMDCEAVEHDLVRAPQHEIVAFGPNEAVVFAFPVFGGRLPSVCPDMLRAFHGQGTPAAAVVVYGNRAFDDALVELIDVVSERGFVPCAAAAFVAQHSLFPKAAAGRPDAADRAAILAFGQSCATKLRAPAATRAAKPLAVPGTRPYVKPSAVPLHPTGSSACNGCGVCARLCPTQAIDAASPRKTDAKRCISCTACIAACPQGARGFHTPIVYPLVNAVFVSSVKARKEPEVFEG